MLTPQVVSVANSVFARLTVRGRGRELGSPSRHPARRSPEKQVPQGPGKECKSCWAGLFAHGASICSPTALEIPSQILSGKAGVYFGNSSLVFEIAVIQLFA